MNNLKMLGVICSFGSLCIIFGSLLKLPLAVQFILLIVGIIAGIIGLIGLSKLLIQPKD